MMPWIDAFAAPLLVLLTLAAVGGFLLHERLRLPPSPRCAAPLPAHRWLWVSVWAALALGAMAWSVAGGAHSPWLLLDQRVQHWVQQQGGAAWLPLVRAFTQLGHLGWMTVLGVVAMAWLVWRRAWLLAGAWVLGVAGVGLWIRIIKLAVARDRPEVRWAMEQGYSFPSGHSAGTLVTYGLLAWAGLALARPVRARWRVAVTALVVLVVWGIGVSRVLLGVHFVSDVLAGWCLGLAWLGLVIWLAEAAQYRAGQRSVR